jgi:uncharacterized coiled-coil protein SlyX
MSTVADTLFAEIEKCLKPSERPILEALRVYVTELEEERRRLREQVEILTRRVEELEGQLAKNRSNSSKPPRTERQETGWTTRAQRVSSKNER